MAESDAAAALTVGHRSRQLALRRQTVRDLTHLWPAWSIDDPGSFDSFVDVAATVTIARRRESAGMAASYYEAYRLAEGVEGAATLRLAGELERERLVGYLRGAGLGGTVRALKSGRSMEAARQIGFSDLAGAVTLQTLNGGRDTILRSVSADRQAVGWQRVTAGDPCAFCVMLAGRGPVYKTAGTARFQPHKHCACTAEPAYGRSWRDDNRAHQQTYSDAQQWARDNGQMPTGTSNDQLNALRRFLSR